MLLEVRMNFSDRLKELRIDRGLTVRELASVFDVSPSTISNYEQEYRRPDFETLGKFADYFDVSTDYILGRTEDPHGTD
jgi:transcriptional regulator with XRE-family HTH domain